jgi:putative DNA primase/helicase
MDNDDVIEQLKQLENIPPPPAPTEDDIALAFAERYCDVLRYVDGWGRWMLFDGSCWQHDGTLHVFDMARTLCRETADETFRNRAKSASVIAAVERLARSDRRLAMTTAAWDCNHMLLNAQGTVIDLETGDTRSIDPLDYCTKAAGCTVAPAGAPHPIWSAFLARVLPDQDVQLFLQRFCGYALTGCTDEHALLFLFGTGANGKTTFIETMAAVLGTYWTNASMDTFLASATPQHPTDLAKLHSARLVTAVETQKGRRWDESRIKAITGGDTISARFMHRDFFDFRPTFKLLIAGNHKPVLSTVDEAMKRRLVMVPFNVQVPPEERDLQLRQKLRAEHPAILRWAVDGCLRWQAMRLSPPSQVVAATNEYFDSQDVLGEWLIEQTVSAPASTVTRLTTLFGAWRDWCEPRNHKPGSVRSFGDQLCDRSGYQRRREPGTGQRGIAGLALKSGV